MRPLKLTLVTLLLIGVGFLALFVVLELFPGTKANLDTGRVWALCLVSLAATAYAFVCIEWHNLGKPASCEWLKKNKMHEVLARIDAEGATCLVIEHEGVHRMFRFEGFLSEDIRSKNIQAGSTFTIRKKYRGIFGDSDAGLSELGKEIGERTRDGEHVLTVIEPMRASL